MIPIAPIKGILFNRRTPRPLGFTEKKSGDSEGLLF